MVGSFVRFNEEDEGYIPEEEERAFNTRIYFLILTYLTRADLRIVNNTESHVTVESVFFFPTRTHYLLSENNAWFQFNDSPTIGSRNWKKERFK